TPGSVDSLTHETDCGADDPAVLELVPAGFESDPVQPAVASTATARVRAATAGRRRIRSLHPGVGVGVEEVDEARGQPDVGAGGESLQPLLDVRRQAEPADELVHR